MMMPVVTMPDGAAVNFPDDMPPDQIKALIAEKFPDAVKSMQPGVLGKIGSAISDRFKNPPNELSLIGMAGRAYKAFTDPIPEVGDREAMVSRGVDIAAVGSPISAGSALRRGVPPLTKPAPPIGRDAVPVPTRSELVETAGKQFEEFKSVGSEFAPETTGALADHVKAALRSQGSYEHLADNVHKTVDLLRKETPTKLDEVRSVLEALGTLKIDPDSKVRRAAGRASKEITEFLGRVEPEAAAILKKANANYAAASRDKRIGEAADIAGLNTGSAGYGGNAVNHMRQALKPFVKDAIKGNPKGFKPDEIRALNDIIEGDTVTNTLRGFGQMSPSKGIIATGLMIGTGGITAGVGAVSNKLATVLTAKQIERMNELIRKRSPAYKDAVEKATEKYFTAADEFAAKPSQAALLKTVIGARALSAGLARDGITVPSGELLRQLQRPMKAAAEDDEP